MLYNEQQCYWDFMPEDYNYVENMQVKHLEEEKIDDLISLIADDEDETSRLNYIYNQPEMQTRFIMHYDEVAQYEDDEFSDEDIEAFMPDIASLKFYS